MDMTFEELQLAHAGLCQAVFYLKPEEEVKQGMLSLAAKILAEIETRPEHEALMAQVA